VIEGYTPLGLRTGPEVLLSKHSHALVARWKKSQKTRNSEWHSEEVEEHQFDFSETRIARI
jgi:hypothetical protein